ncbi:MAG: hypothetical protein CMH53_10350 [Myxococcales bacterium]|nr:hypothetical protein [Myxococcales bacterium]
MRTALATAMTFLLATSMTWPANANPKKVSEILSRSGRFGAVRGPKTIDSATKDKISALMRQVSQRTGGRAFAVILPSGTRTKAYARLYSTLKMTPRDILIVSNGSQWSVRCDGISKQQKQDMMSSVMSLGGDPLGRMRRLSEALPEALESSQEQTTHNGIAIDSTIPKHDPLQGDHRSHPSQSDSPWATAAFLLFVAGGVGFVILRRKRRDAAIEADFSDALEPVETRLTELYLNLDGLENHPDFDALLSDATATSTELDDLKGKAPSRETIAKLRRLSSDAAGLHLRRESIAADQD